MLNSLFIRSKCHISVAEISLFDRLGGRSAVRQLASRFYDIMQREPGTQSILNMHPQDLKHSRKRLENYLCEWLGGPELFGAAYMHADWIKHRHQHLVIGLSERDQWLHCMQLALHELEVDKDVQFELNKRFFQLAGYIRNQV